MLDPAVKQRNTTVSQHAVLLAEPVLISSFPDQGVVQMVIQTEQALTKQVTRPSTLACFAVPSRRRHHLGTGALV